MSPKPKLSKALESATGQLAAYQSEPEDDKRQSVGAMAWEAWPDITSLVTAGPASCLFPGVDPSDRLHF